MSNAAPDLRRCAEQLMAHERPLEEKSSQATGEAAFNVIDKLRPELTNLMGTGGLRALLSRSLALANEEVRWLRAVHVKADGSFTGLKELQAQLDPAQFVEGKVVLLAQLLGLLVAFLGPGLTLRLVSEIWPQISLSDLDFGRGT